MDEHLKALHDTLKAAADSNTRAILNPREAREGAKAIERATADNLGEASHSSFALNEMAAQIEYWIRYNTEQRAREGLETTSETNLMSPPYWPSHGQLETWVKALRGEIGRSAAQDVGEGRALRRCGYRFSGSFAGNYPSFDDYVE